MELYEYQSGDWLALASTSLIHSLAVGFITAVKVCLMCRCVMPYDHCLICSSQS